MNTALSVCMFCAFVSAPLGAAQNSEDLVTWQGEIDPTTGRASFLYGGRLEPLFEPLVESECVLLAELFIEQTRANHGVAPRTLRLEHVKFLPLAQIGASDKWSIRFVQELGGFPVVGGALNVLLS